MARENQGLQISLILFIIFTVILAALSFWFYSLWQEADKNRAQAEQREQTEKSNASKATNENNRLKELLGVSAADSLQKVEQTFTDDVAAFGASLPETDRFYRPMLAQTYKALQTRNTELADAQSELKKFKDQYEVREARTESEIKKYQDTAEAHNVDLLNERKQFEEGRNRLLADQKQLSDKLAALRKTGEDAVAAVQAKFDDLAKQYNKLQQLFDKSQAVIAQYQTDVAEKADGEVTYVNQRAGRVWVNLGSADSVSPQTTFAVYDGSATNLDKKAKKASVEVVSVLGEHLSEARVTEDDPRRPITPGDKIDTPIWSPGDRPHFALTGFFDINGDGRDDQQAVRDLITRNGGVIDAETLPGGKRKGEITIGTQYLVVGKEPGKEGEPNPAESAAYSAMEQDAARYRLKKITLPELLSRSGYENVTPIITYGRGANPSDFKPRAPEGIPASRGTGNTSGLFQPRTPPAGAAF